MLSKAVAEEVEEEEGAGAGKRWKGALLVAAW
jgi:hypothetical protein